MHHYTVLISLPPMVRMVVSIKGKKILKIHEAFFCLCTWFTGAYKQEIFFFILIFILLPVDHFKRQCIY
jgi:hypothetical protein